MPDTPVRVDVDSARSPRRFCWKGLLWRCVTIQYWWKESGQWWSLDAASENTCWRVEARNAGGESGVFELVNGEGQWWLRSVID